MKTLQFITGQTNIFKILLILFYVCLLWVSLIGLISSLIVEPSLMYNASFQNL